MSEIVVDLGNGHTVKLGYNDHGYNYGYYNKQFIITFWS